MFALAAAIVFFLMSLGVVEDTADIKYLPLALGLWALHFAFTIVIPWPTQVVRREPQ